jgi:hypothetical protein
MLKFRLNSIVREKKKWILEKLIFPMLMNSSGITVIFNYFNITEKEKLLSVVGTNESFGNIFSIKASLFRTCLSVYSDKDVYQKLNTLQGGIILYSGNKNQVIEILKKVKSQVNLIPLMFIIDRHVYYYEGDVEKHFELFLDEFGLKKAIIFRIFGLVSSGIKANVFCLKPFQGLFNMQEIKNIK